MMKLSRSIKFALFGGAFTYFMPLSVLAQQAQVNIAIQPLGQALNQLSEQTGTVIIAPSRLVGDKQSVATTGKLSVIKAVEQLIKGSGLKAHKEPSGAIVIKKADTVSSSIKPVSDYQAPLDEVVVTGLKRESSLQDTPLAITVLGGNELKALGVTDFTDLIGNLSGISINSAYGGPENSLGGPWVGRAFGFLIFYTSLLLMRNCCSMERPRKNMTRASPWLAPREANASKARGPS